jgi:hypothetical protein
MANYSDLQRTIKSERHPWFATITGAGVAAVLAALPGLFTLIRGEPQAQETFKYLKQSSATLLENQQKQHDRLVKLEAVIDAYSLMRKDRKEDVTQQLLLLMTEAITSRKPGDKVTSFPISPISLSSSGVPVSLRCRPGFVEEAGVCIRVREALNIKEAQTQQLELEHSRMTQEKRQLNDQLKRVKKRLDVKQRPTSTSIPDELTP